MYVCNYRRNRFGLLGLISVVLTSRMEKPILPKKQSAEKINICMPETNQLKFIIQITKSLTIAQSLLVLNGTTLNMKLFTEMLT